MNNKDLKGLKYYLAYGVLVIGFFAYSGSVGWKWFNPTSTEHEKAQGHGRGVVRGSYLRYHK